jgi:hypothetical protein
MDSIFTVAGTTENLRKAFDISGLSGYTLYFRCDEGVSEFGLSGQPAAVTDSTMPLFAPSELQGTKMLLWSMPYRLPFKVIDLLMVTSDKTAYLVWGEDDFSSQFLKTVQDFSNDPDMSSQGKSLFNVREIKDFADMELGKVFQVRVVDVQGQIKDHAPLPLPLQEQTKTLADDKVTAVSFVGGNLVNFYQRKDTYWALQNKAPLNLIVLPEKKPAAKFAAVFAGTSEAYQCNMLKALDRLKYLNELYGGKEITSGIPGGKLGTLIGFYGSPQASGKECLNYLEVYDNNAVDALASHQNAVKGCVLQLAGNPFYPCTDLVASAYALQGANKALSEKGDCLSLY